MRSPLKVFIVENHEDTRFLLAYLIRHAGYDVQEAASLGEALRDLPGSGADVLISDIGLPDGSGWELLKRLGDHRPAYAIAMTGFGMSTDVAESRAAGFRHHLVKPVEPEMIERLLQEAAEEKTH